MGGIGSGSWFRWNSRKTIESQHGLDIRWLNKQGDLRSGAIGFLSWSTRGKETGSIRYRIEETRLVLNYQHRFRGGEWERVEQAIEFDRTPCHYGGHRTWFLCPQCWRRIAVLYGAGKFFRCRHCYGLAYSSQKERLSDRLMRKARGIRERLGGGRNLFESFPSKPKNMHCETYNRLSIEAKIAEYRMWKIEGQRLGTTFLRSA